MRSAPRCRRRSGSCCARFVAVRAATRAPFGERVLVDVEYAAHATRVAALVGRGARGVAANRQRSRLPLAQVRRQATLGVGHERAELAQLALRLRACCLRRAACGCARSTRRDRCAFLRASSRTGSALLASCDMRHGRARLARGAAPCAGPRGAARPSRREPRAGAGAAGGGGRRSGRELALLRGASLRGAGVGIGCAWPRAVTRRRAAACGDLRRRIGQRRAPSFARRACPRTRLVDPVASCIASCRDNWLGAAAGGRRPSPWRSVLRHRVAGASAAASPASGCAIETPRALASAAFASAAGCAGGGGASFSSASVAQATAADDVVSSAGGSGGAS